MTRKKSAAQRWREMPREHRKSTMIMIDDYGWPYSSSPRRDECVTLALAVLREAARAPKKKARKR